MITRRQFAAYSSTSAVAGIALPLTSHAQVNTTNNGWFNVRNYGASGNGTSDDTTAIEKAINAVVAIGGGTVYFPIGTYKITRTIVMPNRVAFKGDGRSSEIMADSAFSQQQMLYAVNGKTSMFFSRLDDITLNANDVTAIVAVLIAEAWQETSGASRLLIRNFRDRGMLIRYGYGGASWTKLSEIEIFGSQYGSKIGIECQQVSSVGAFMLHISGASIAAAGTQASAIGTGISIRKDSLLAEAIHFEDCKYGIDLGGPGNSIIRGVTASFDGYIVNELIAISSDFTGSAVLQAINPNGATTTLRDYRTGISRTGRIAQLVI